MTPRKIVIGSVAVGLFAGLAAMFIKMPASWTSGWMLFYVPLVATIVYAFFHMGAALLFMTSLKVYKTTLKHAYIAIAAGIVALALSTLQVAIIAAFDWWNTPWSQDGFIILPFLIAGIVVYMGVRKLAKLTGTVSLLRNALLVIPAIILLSLLTALLPHVHTTTAEVAFDASNIFITWTVLMYLAAMLTTLAIKRHMGTHYTRAMAWLASGFAVSCTILTVVVVHSLFVDQARGQDVVSMMVDLVGVLSGVVYLRAGYEFTRTEEV
ncbi:MAG: hypothetical protein ACQR33_02015 [Candidatus Saccharibacteria bacterium]